VTAWAQQAGLQLIWEAAGTVTTRVSPRVSGLYGKEQALKLLLEGTGLTYSFPRPDTVVIRSGMKQSSKQAAARSLASTADPYPQPSAPAERACRRQRRQSRRRGEGDDRAGGDRGDGHAYPRSTQ